MYHIDCWWHIMLLVKLLGLLIKHLRLTKKRQFHLILWLRDLFFKDTNGVLLKGMLMGSQIQILLWSAVKSFLFLSSFFSFFCVSKNVWWFKWNMSNSACAISTKWLFIKKMYPVITNDFNLFIWPALRRGTLLSVYYFKSGLGQYYTCIKIVGLAYIWEPSLSSHSHGRSIMCAYTHKDTSLSVHAVWFWWFCWLKYSRVTVDDGRNQAVLGCN